LLPSWQLLRRQEEVAEAEQRQRVGIEENLKGEKKKKKKNIMGFIIIFNYKRVKTK